MDKKQARSRSSRKTRVRIAEQRATGWCQPLELPHLRAQIIAPEGNKVLASVDGRSRRAQGQERRQQGGRRVGWRARRKAKTLGIEAAASDRSDSASTAVKALASRSVRAV
jgi:large subunit ribosomal protein L18